MSGLCMALKSPHTLREYVVGEWTVTRRMVYNRGGSDGTFSGHARFHPMSQEDRIVVCAEQGDVRLHGHSGGAPLKAHRAHLWDLAGLWTPSEARMRCMWMSTL